MKRLISRKWLFFMMLFSGVKYSYSQQSVIWNSLQFPVQFSSQWHMPLDISYRTIGFSSSAYQYTFRTGVRHFFNDEWNAAAGMALFVARTSYEKADHDFGNEYRVWQEAVSQKKVSEKFSVQNRIRIEQRFFEATHLADSYTGHRFRYRLEGICFLNSRLRLQLWDEYMQQADRGNFYMQQNRLGSTIAWFFTKNSHCQAGYIWSARPGIDQHILLLTFQKAIVLHGNSNRK